MGSMLWTSGGRDMNMLASRLSFALSLVLVAAALAACGPAYRARAMGDEVPMASGWLAFSMDG
jgi:hypothetical protein